jgi:hypothetical protein
MSLTPQGRMPPLGLVNANSFVHHHFLPSTLFSFATLTELKEGVTDSLEFKSTLADFKPIAALFDGFRVFCNAVFDLIV